MGKSMNEQDDAIISMIADKVVKGECILFLGAGVHYGPPNGSSYSYPTEKSPPVGAALAEKLAVGCDFRAKFPKGSSSDLQRVSLCYELTFTRNEMVQAVRDAVDAGKEPSPALLGLARLNFPIVITTNYDQLFERALRSVGKEPVVSVYRPAETSLTTVFQDGDPDEKHPFVLKLHGDIGQSESIVITDEDYIQFVLRMSDKEPYHPVPMTVKYRFPMWSTLFIGYSLIDYNIRLLFKTLRWKVDRSNFRPTYSVDPYPDPLIVDVWHNQLRYVQFVTQDVWTFVPKLYKLIAQEDMPG
jgi:hypothetical protein